MLLTPELGVHFTEPLRGLHGGGTGLEGEPIRGRIHSFIHSNPFSDPLP